MKTLKNYFIFSILFFLIVLSFVVFAPTVYAEPVGLEGQGTETSPYLIEDQSDLEIFALYINSGNCQGEYFRLERSISAGEGFVPIGTQENPFKGFFDGNGKQISGVKFENGEYLGLFGVIENAKISNLGVEIEIVISGETERVVGGIVAKATSSTISGCYSKISFSATKIDRQEEQFASAFSTKIENTEKTALYGVSSVTGLNEGDYSIENSYLVFNSPGIFNFSAQLNGRASEYVAVVSQNLETTFFSKTVAPTNISSKDFKNLEGTGVSVVDGNLVYSEAGIFKFQISDSIYYAVVSSKGAGFEGKVFSQAAAPTTFEFETYGYNNKITFGGLVGEMIDSYILNSYSIPTVSICFEENSFEYSSVFGGVCGSATNGEIINVYAAPSNELVSELVSKSGDFFKVTFNFAPFKINNLSAGNSVVFGGVIGTAKGSGLKVYNSMFFSILASLSEGNISRGGIVGEISENNSLWPEIMYGKYLSLSNLSSNLLIFSSGVGNASAVGYNLNSSVSSANAMPTQQTFNSWAWNEFRAWDFENTWKNSSIIASLGYFFPSLQKFAIVEISVSGTNEVVFTPGGNYLRGFYTLEIEGQTSKSVEFATGSTVTLVAKFYNEQGNVLRDFNKYFTFTDWVKNTYSVSKINYGGVAAVSSENYSIILDEESGQTKITFVASSQTEGEYDVKIKGRPVEVSVYLRNSETEKNQNNIGKITKSYNNKIEEYSTSFSFNIENYLNGENITLTANDSENGNFKFSGKWVDENLETQIALTSSITIELNNEKNSTTSRFYPKVVPTENGLVANVVAYFSEYTIPLTIVSNGGGSIMFNGEEVTTTLTKNVLIGEIIKLTAVPNKDMELESWTINGVLQESKDLSYEYNPSVATTITVSFKKTVIEPKGLETWAIVLIVLGTILVVVGVVLAIVFLKRRSYKSYKKSFKNFRY